MACSIATTNTCTLATPRHHRRDLQSDLQAMLRRQPQYGNGYGVNATALMIPIVIQAFGPLPPLISFLLPANATVAIILATIIRNLRLPARVAQLLRLTRLGGQNVSANTPLSSLVGPPVRNAYGQMVQQPITLEVRVATRGGKGGFGSQLRAAGGKMSASRNNNGEENRDSCRDLNGRRLSTVKQARQLASYLASEGERNRQLSETQKKKYAKLEKMLGRKPQGEADFVEAAQRLDDQGEGFEEGDETENDDRGEGSSRSAALQKSSSLPASSNQSGKGKKRERIEDSEFIEQSRAAVENVRSAVASAMLKKKKKLKGNLPTKNTPAKDKEVNKDIQLPKVTAPEPVR